MPRSVQEPTTRVHDESYRKGAVEEKHPAFGLVKASRVSSTPGAVLFDSEIRHREYVVLSVKRASRTRDLNRDWIHDDGRADLISIALSEAQWASLVSSFGSSGVPCTIQATETDHQVPGLPFAPRLEQSVAEVTDAADKTYARVKEALAAVEEKPTKANIRNLRLAVDHVGANLEFAAESLTQHVENVVQKARFDIEAMVSAHAESLGLTSADMPTLALTAGEDEAE